MAVFGSDLECRFCIQNLYSELDSKEPLAKTFEVVHCSLFVIQQSLHPIGWYWKIELYIRISECGKWPLKMLKGPDKCLDSWLES